MELLNSEELASMINLAFAGCMRGKVKQARDIFSQILIAEPNNKSAKTGLAFTHIVVDEFKEADSLLQEVIDSDILDEDPKGFLVLSKKLQGDTESAEKIMLSMLDKTSCGYKLAQQALALNK